MTTYTIIAYRPNGTDMCMNNVMGTSDSALEFESFSDAEEAAGYAGGLLFENEIETRREVAGWELTYLIDGEECWQGELEALAGKSLKERISKHKEAQAQKRKEARRAAEKRRIEAERKKEAAEREMLEVLKHKYEGGQP